MTLIAVAAFCVLLLILAFLFPRFSRRPERGGKRVMGFGSRGASKAPGKLGTWMSKPFSQGSKAIGKSASAGRKGRGKLPH